MSDALVSCTGYYAIVFNVVYPPQAIPWWQVGGCGHFQCVLSMTRDFAVISVHVLYSILKCSMALVQHSFVDYCQGSWCPTFTCQLAFCPGRGSSSPLICGPTTLLNTKASKINLAWLERDVNIPPN